MRESVLQDILSSVYRGESRHIAGIGRSGKTTLIRHLLAGQQHEELDRIVFVHLEPARLPLPDSAQADEWGGFYVMLEMFQETLATCDDLPDSLINQLDARVHEAYDDSRRGPQRVFSLLQKSIKAFAHHVSDEDWRLVFIFDDFQEWIQQMPASFFDKFNALRRSQQQRIVFLVFDNLLSWEQENLSVFKKMFYEEQIVLGPYDEADTRQIIAGEIKRHTIDNPGHIQTVMNRVLYIADGWGGLTRACMVNYETVLKARSTMAAIDDLLSIERICYELDQILISLPPQALPLLCRIVASDYRKGHTGNLTEAQLRRRLINYSVVTESGVDVFDVSPPLLKYYLINQKCKN